MATTSEITYRPIFRYDDGCGTSYGPVSGSLDDAFEDAKALLARFKMAKMADRGQIVVEQTTTTTTTTDVMHLPRA